MHSIVLFTAMTATSGLFGGHRQVRTATCTTGSCPRPAAVAYAPTAQHQPVAYAAPAYAPSAQVYAQPAANYAPAVSYNSYYYPAPCATGTCPRR